MATGSDTNHAFDKYMKDETDSMCLSRRKQVGGGRGGKGERRGRGSHFFGLCLEKHLLSGIWCHARFSPPQAGTK